MFYNRRLSRIESGQIRYKLTRNATVHAQSKERLRIFPRLIECPKPIGEVDVKSIRSSLTEMRLLHEGLSADYYPNWPEDCLILRR